MPVICTTKITSLPWWPKDFYADKKITITYIRSLKNSDSENKTKQKIQPSNKQRNSCEIIQQSEQQKKVSLGEFNQESIFSCKTSHSQHTENGPRLICTVNVFCSDRPPCSERHPRGSAQTTQCPIVEQFQTRVHSIKQGFSPAPWREQSNIQRIKRKQDPNIL